MVPRLGTRCTRPRHRLVWWRRRRAQNAPFKCLLGTFCLLGELLFRLFGSFSLGRSHRVLVLHLFVRHGLSLLRCLPSLLHLGCHCSYLMLRRRRCLSFGWLWCRRNRSCWG